MRKYFPHPEKIEKDASGSPFPLEECAFSM